MKKNPNGLDMQQIRRKLESTEGKHYWKGLEELAETDDFKSWLDDEFPHRSSIPDIDRRGFLKLVGASLALAGLAGCRNLPQEKLIPYVKAPEDIVPGLKLFYASAFTLGGYATGILVESHEGRPTKIEGNPDHPASLGSSDVFAQASILNLYDPDRQAGVSLNGLPSTWDDFFAEARSVLKAQKASGSKIRVLTGNVTSPTLKAQIDGLMKAFPGAKWHQFESASRDSVYAGAMAAFGEPVTTVYDFARADRIVSLDADFLSAMPGSVRYARDYSSRRDLAQPEDMNRLYAFQSAPNLAGANADHVWPVKPSEIEGVARQLAAALGIPVSPAKPVVAPAVITAIVADLQAKKGASIVLAGDHQTPATHELCHAINAALGNVGTTVKYVEAVEAKPENQIDSLISLVADMKSGAVDTLLIVDTNPVYSAPSDLRFGEALRKVKNSWRLGHFYDETSDLCKWHLPLSHDLEAWGDARAYDGTTTIIQPLIEPLFHSKSAIELIGALVNKPMPGLDIVQAQYKASDALWQSMLDKGSVPGSASPVKQVTAKAVSLPVSKAPGGTEVVFLPDPTVWDGCFTNNGWLQELPKPMSKLTWDNAVYMSPKTAENMAVAEEQKVEVTVGVNSVKAPVMIQPGLADGVLVLHLGYGRTKGGKVMVGTGFDFGVLRTSDAMPIAGATVGKADGSYKLSSAQMHHSMEGRDLYREGTVAEYLKHKSLAPENAEEGEDELTGPYYNTTKEWTAENPELPQWGMVIDLNTCIGCNACVTSCQAENNISVVGKTEVSRGREMHWIRVDRYYRVHDAGSVRDVEADGVVDGETVKGPGAAIDGSAAALKKVDVLDSSKIETVFQPVTCMHCEVAPCEPVCPVAATVHSHEGLNQMVYNRCVGTRYCSNNCPYKVRRFNYHNYQIGQTELWNDKIGKPYGQRNFQGEEDMPLLRLLNNPNVTVRSRGVMEKCTYCVQRINEVRIEAKKAGRAIKDGEIVPACAQACPARAITFGNIADPNSAVSQKKAEKRNYSMLKELNTVPRTTYLAKVRNTNPEVKA